jgi:glyoxylase-like metal-dependent hydrolase (beta-lactamase superfamily II)
MSGGEIAVKIAFIEAGYCRHPEKVAWRGGSWASVSFPASVAVIEHPREGIVLFDTGYSERFFHATQKWPASLYARITPVFLDEGRTARDQLKRIGVAPTDVRHVILSHFHGDHIGGVSDFTRAGFVYDHEGFEAVRGLKGIAALRRAFLPELLPADFEARGRAVGAWSKGPAELHGFSGAHDVFGDGSVWLVRLPGHARGHAGLLVRTQGRDYLLAGDACYRRENFTGNSPALAAARLIFDDFSGYKRTLGDLHSLHLARPDLEIVPCHCEKTLGRMPALETVFDHAHA